MARQAAALFEGLRAPRGDLGGADLLGDVPLDAQAARTCGTSLLRIAKHTLVQDSAKAIDSISTPLAVPDTWVYRIVVIALGLAVLVVIVGGIALSSQTIAQGADGQLVQKEFPASLIAIGSAAVGALAGLLAPSPAAK